MKRKTIFITTLASCGLIAAVSVVALSLPAKTSASPAPLSYSASPQSISPAAVSEAPTSYVLREYEGVIAVFKLGDSVPITVYDVPVSHLPEYDQDSLKSGIIAKNEVDLATLIEDYTS